MTSFLESASKVKVRKGPPCQVRVMLADLPDDLREEVVTAMADTDHYSGPQIIQTLEGLGFATVPKHTLARHRRGDCSCD